MKAVVIGGSGLIGSRLVAKLREQGHEAVPASPDTGVNTLTGEGLAAVLEGAGVVIDVSNSPALDGESALAFFRTSTRNLLAAEEAAGVGHHVALSVVGTDRMSEGGYFRAKLAQEALIAAGPIPYTIVHATQFFEFLRAIAGAATTENAVRIPPVLFQPIAADDIAGAVCSVALGSPVNGVVEVAGPDEFQMDDLVGRYLREKGDPRVVIADPGATYFGVAVEQRTLLPAAHPRLGATRFDEWMRQDDAATQRSPASST